MDILQQSLPQFFTTGLVATSFNLPLDVHSLLGGKSNPSDQELQDNDEGAGIYSRSVRLEYTPPMSLPSPFPRLLAHALGRILSGN